MSEDEIIKRPIRRTVKISRVTCCTEKPKIAETCTAVKDAAPAIKEIPIAKKQNIKLPVEETTDLKDYMLLANPVGKVRVVGAPKRNRKEQLPVAEQIFAGNELAKTYGGEVIEPAELKANSFATNKSPLFCVSSSSSSSTSSSSSSGCINAQPKNDQDAVDPSVGEFSRWKQCYPKPGFLRNIRLEKKQSNTAPIKSGCVLAEKQVEDDPEFQDCAERPNSNIIVSKTDSTFIEPYDFRPYDTKHQFPDEALSQLRGMQDEVYQNAHADYVARHFPAAVADSAEAINAAHEHFDSCGYGRAVVTMENFDITRWEQHSKEATEPLSSAIDNSPEAVLLKQEQARSKSLCATLACRYPHSTKLRCRYDHHTFDSIPILLPLAYRPEPHNILEVLPNVAFCSFACAMAYVDREAPRLHHSVRNDRQTLLKFMARRFFGISHALRPAPMLELHCDYGGRLTTSQFRRLSDTHHSFIEYPLAVAVPATYVTHISITRRIDRAKRQGLHLRVSEQHGEALAPQPEDLVIDKNAPAAPRGAEARAARARQAAANATAASLLGADQTKKRVVKDDAGEEVIIDRSHIENVIGKTAKQSKEAPEKKHMLEKMLNIQEMKFNSVDDADNDDGFSATVAPAQLLKKAEKQPPPPAHSAWTDDYDLFADIRQTTMEFVNDEKRRQADMEFQAVEEPASTKKRQATEQRKKIAKKRKAALQTVPTENENDTLVEEKPEAKKVFSETGDPKLKRKVGRPRKNPLPTENPINEAADASTQK